MDDSSPPPRQDLLFHQPPHQQTSTAATEAATNAASDTGSSSFIQPNFPGSVWELWIFELNNTFTPPPSTCTAGLDPLSWIQFASYGNGNHGNHTDLLGESTVDGEIVGSEGEHGGPSTSSLFIGRGCIFL